MARAPFTIQPDLTGIAIAFKNRGFIADMIARYQQVNAELFEIDYVDIDGAFETPDDQVGRLSAPNQITWSTTRQQFSVVDHGLDAPVPRRDIKSYQGVGPSPAAIATERIMDNLTTNREVRVADLFQDPNNYKPNLQQTLSGTSQFSDYANSDPIGALLEWLDVPLVRPNTMILSTYGLRLLRQHPRVVEAIRGTGAGTDAVGVVGRDAIREVLELENLYVGTARAKAMPRNISAPDTTPPRIWGKHICLVTVDPLARTTNTNRPTFAITARHGNRVAGTIEDPDMGLEGGYRVRAGESVKEVIISKEGAYFVENAFA